MWVWKVGVGKCQRGAEAPTSTAHNRFTHTHRRVLHLPTHLVVLWFKPTTTNTINKTTRHKQQSERKNRGIQPEGWIVLHATEQHRMYYSTLTLQHGSGITIRCTRRVLVSHIHAQTTLQGKGTQDNTTTHTFPPRLPNLHWQEKNLLTYPRF